VNKAQAVRVTINSPGWEHIQQMMEARIEQARLAALVNTEENCVLELWRRAQVADQLFRTFLQDIENLTDPGLDQGESYEDR
jgi:hypothetical protein